MLKICTVYFDGFYTPDYVARLHDSLRKHSSIDFEFVCLSDDELSNFYLNNKTTEEISNNPISKIFKNFKI